MSRLLVFEFLLSFGALFLAGALGIPLLLAGFGVKLWGMGDDKSWAYACFIAAGVAVLFFWPPLFDRIQRCSQIEPYSFSFEAGHIGTSPNPEFKELECGNFPYNLGR